MATTEAPPQLQLHIWGPGFGLPSFDVECLAAVAYLSFLFRREAWTLIPSNNPTLSPQNKLPLLVDGPYFISGFTGIADHLRKRTAYPTSLDLQLPPISRAESKAFSALILTRATPILDFTLWLDHDNYTDVTRPLMASQFGMIARYTYPQKLRNEALKRSGEFFKGVSTKETSMVPVGPPKSNVIEAVDLSSTTSLMPNTRSPFASLTTPESKATFKLESLCERFFAPLTDKLSSSTFLISEDDDKPSEADCLALAYLNLLLAADVPNNVVQKLLKEKYPRLCGWTHHLSGRVFGPAIQPVDVLSLEETKIIGTHGLQWGAAETGDLLWLSKFVFRSVMGKGNVEKQKVLERLRAEREAAETPLERENRLRAEAIRRNRRIWNFAVVTAGVLGWVFYVNAVHFSGGGEEEQEEEEEEEEEEEPRTKMEAPQLGWNPFLNGMQTVYETNEAVDDDDDDVRDALFSENGNDDDEDDL